MGVEFSGGSVEGYFLGGIFFRGWIFSRGLMPVTEKGKVKIKKNANFLNKNYASNVFNADKNQKRTETFNNKKKGIATNPVNERR